MRRLDEQFMDDFESRMLKPLLEAVIRDRDLSMEIRENYVNIYFRG